MTIDDLIKKIDASRAETITIERLGVKKGNQGQNGDYKIIKLSIGSDDVYFNNKNGVWIIGK